MKQKKAIITVDLHEGGRGVVKVEFVGESLWSNTEINAIAGKMIKGQRILRNDIRRRETKQAREAEAQATRDLEKDEQKEIEELADSLFEKPHSKSVKKRLVIQTESNQSLTVK